MKNDDWKFTKYLTFSSSKLFPWLMHSVKQKSWTILLESIKIKTIQHCCTDMEKINERRCPSPLGDQCVCTIWRAKVLYGVLLTSYLQTFSHFPYQMYFCMIWNLHFCACQCRQNYQELYSIYCTFLSLFQPGLHVWKYIRCIHLNLSSSEFFPFCEHKVRICFCLGSLDRTAYTLDGI